MLNNCLDQAINRKLFRLDIHIEAKFTGCLRCDGTNTSYFSIRKGCYNILFLVSEFGFCYAGYLTPRQGSRKGCHYIFKPVHKITYGRRTGEGQDVELTSLKQAQYFTSLLIITCCSDGAIR